MTFSRGEPITRVRRLPIESAASSIHCREQLRSDGPQGNPRPKVRRVHEASCHLAYSENQNVVRLAYSPNPASEIYSCSLVPRDLLNDAKNRLSSAEGVNRRRKSRVKGQKRVGLSLAGAGRCRSQSFPRKRESISQTFGNTRSTDWIPPAMAGRK